MYSWIDRRDYRQVFSSASEVAVARRGDCTEYAVLLAAVCRARQIPCRLVLGLVYAPEQQGFECQGILCSLGKLGSSLLHRFVWYPV